MSDIQEKTKSAEKPFECRVINYINPVLESAMYGTALDKDIIEFLNGFNHFDFDDHVLSLSKDKVVERVSDAENLFNEFDIRIRMQRLWTRVRQIQPDFEPSPVPFYFIYAGPKTSAKSLSGTAVVVNLGHFLSRANEYSRTQMLEQIESACIHEGVHVLLEQLRLSQRYSDLQEIMKIVWEDGLATFMEFVHDSETVAYYNDVDFWLNVLRDWLRTNGNEKQNERKVAIINRCLQNKIMCKIGQALVKRTRRDLKECKDLDELFTTLMFCSNGPAYHVGRFLWEREISQGGQLPELVKKGSGQVTDWILRLT
ncbi:hypothetical protein JW887_04190 [Candidatus Dojkabacteria bacterium]|nr:hypothetical protein [Candidatus Dojkabacteria bacterium]